MTSTSMPDTCSKTACNSPLGIRGGTYAAVKLGLEDARDQLADT